MQKVLTDSCREITRKISTTVHTCVHNMDCLDPRRMASNKDSSCINKLKSILKLLTETKRVDENDCDDILKQYRKFINETVQKRRADFTDFNPVTGQVDTLFYETMAGEKVYKTLWNVVALQPLSKVFQSINKSRLKT